MSHFSEQFHLLLYDRSSSLCWSLLWCSRTMMSWQHMLTSYLDPSLIMWITELLLSLLTVWKTWWISCSLKETLIHLVPGGFSQMIHFLFFKRLCSLLFWLIKCSTVSIMKWIKEKIVNAVFTNGFKLKSYTIACHNDNGTLCKSHVVLFLCYNLCYSFIIPFKEISW